MMKRKSFVGGLLALSGVAAAEALAAGGEAVVAELDAAWAEWMKDTGPTGRRSQGATWRKDNPGEWRQLRDYRDGFGPRPNLLSNTGRQMVNETAAWFAAKAITPPEPPPPAEIPDPPVIPPQLANRKIVVTVTGNLEKVGEHWLAKDVFVTNQGA